MINSLFFFFYLYVVVVVAFVVEPCMTQKVMNMTIWQSALICANNTFCHSWMDYCPVLTAIINHVRQ